MFFCRISPVISGSVCFCCYSWPDSWSMISLPFQRSAVDEHYPHRKLTSCVGWHPDSWLFWPRCLYDTLCLHLQRFLSQNRKLCTDNSYSLQGQRQTEPISILLWEICGGLFVYFSADPAVHFAKNCKTERKATGILLPVQKSLDRKKTFFTVSV